MGNLHEQLNGYVGDKLSQAKLQEIQEQIARAEAKRLQRSTPEKDAMKKAIAILPKIRQLGTAVTNRNGVLETTIAYHALQNQPLALVGFWGEGGKETPDGYDEQYFLYLRSLAAMITEWYEPGGDITLILADMHGVFNGFSSDEEKRTSYLRSVEGQLVVHGFQSVWLSDLYTDHNIVLPNEHQPICATEEPFQVLLRNMSQYLASAQKHYKRSSHPVRAAFNYVAMRLNERPMLQAAFPHSILLVNSDKRLAEPVLPQTMPILYLPQRPVWFQHEKVNQILR